MTSYRLLADQVRARLKQRRENPRPVYGFPSGIAPLDEHTGGFHEREITVIAGRPGSGKTALAAQLLHQFARYALATGQAGYLLFFSAEMPALRIVQRELARLTGVSVRQQESGQYSDAEAEDLQAALAELAQLPVEIYDQPGLSADRIAEIVWDYHHGPGVLGVVVDYLQRLASSTRGRPYEAITQTMLTLVGLRDDIEGPLIVLSQLRRPEPGQESSRPEITDLRDSGVIEEAANNVYLLYTPPPNEDSTVLRPAELLIGKARDGELGTIYLEFDSRRLAFQPRSCADAASFGDTAPLSDLEECLVA